MNDLQITVASALGALLILVAAWLLIMRRDASQNRGKFLGLEFDLSTPALAVLLVGAGLLIVPAFVPHRPGGWPRPSGGSTPLDSEGSPEAGTVLRHQTILNSEVEPNNRPGEANVVSYGGTVSGVISPEDPNDQFIFNVSSNEAGKKRLIVRFFTSGYYIGNVYAWDSKERQLFEGQFVSHGTMSEVINASPIYLVEVRGQNFVSISEISYELTIAQD